MLKVPTQQKEFVIDFPKHFKNIGIKMSGGTDSSMLAYMLATYKTNFHHDLNLHVISMDHPSKSFQVKFAKQVMAWIESKFGFEFASHTTGVGTVTGNYDDEQEVLLLKSYQQNKLDGHFMGQTLNPISHHENKTLVDRWEWRAPKRDAENKNNLAGTDFVANEYDEKTKDGMMICGHYPFLFVDKKCVAELYDYFSVKDTLFPITRSCEEETNDFTKHCGKCWWCGEREYGFGRLV